MWLKIWLKPGEFIAQGQRFLRYYIVHALLLTPFADGIGQLRPPAQHHPSASPQYFPRCQYAVFVPNGVYADSGQCPRRPQFAIACFLLDILLLVNMINSSGGLKSGFSKLVQISIIVANVLVLHSLGYVLAA